MANKNRILELNSIINELQMNQGADTFPGIALSFHMEKDAFENANELYAIANKFGFTETQRGKKENKRQSDFKRFRSLNFGYSKDYPDKATATKDAKKFESMVKREVKKLSGKITTTVMAMTSGTFTFSEATNDE